MNTAKGLRWIIHKQNNKAVFIKSFILDVLHFCLRIFFIFIIKPNLVSANNNPELLNFFKDLKGGSKRNSLSIVVKSSILHLIKFLDLPRLNYRAATLQRLLKQICLQEKHVTVTDYSGRWEQDIQ